MDNDTIYRQAAIDALNGICDRECEYSKRQRAVMCASCHLGSAFNVIDDLPSSERRGRWIKTKDLFFNPDGGGFFYGRRCSSCTEISASVTNCCPNCGAKMVNEDDLS